MLQVTQRLGTSKAARLFRAAEHSRNVKNFGVQPVERLERGHVVPEGLAHKVVAREAVEPQ